MPKYMVCVTKIAECFEVVEVEAEDSLKARTKAIKLLKESDGEFRWTEGEKTIFKAEVVNGSDE